MVLQSSVTATYDDYGHGLSVNQHYDYQNPLHIFPTHISSTSSKGQTLDTYNQYVLDYANSSCVNSAQSTFQQSLNSLKTTWFTQFGALYNKFLTYDVQQCYPNCTPLNVDTVIAAVNAYNAALTNEDTAVTHLMSTYNSNLTTCNAPMSSYYNAA